MLYASPVHTHTPYTHLKLTNSSDHDAIGAQSTATERPYCTPGSHRHGPHLPLPVHFESNIMMLLPPGSKHGYVWLDTHIHITLVHVRRISFVSWPAAKQLHNPNTSWTCHWQESNRCSNRRIRHACAIRCTTKLSMTDRRPVRRAEKLIHYLRTEFIYYYTAVQVRHNTIYAQYRHILWPAICTVITPQRKLFLSYPFQR